MFVAFAKLCVMKTKNEAPEATSTMAFETLEHDETIEGVD